MYLNAKWPIFSEPKENVLKKIHGYSIYNE